MSPHHSTITHHDVNTDLITQMAKLARIAITPEECERFSKNLGDILGHMEALNAVNTENIEPMYHALDLHQRLDPDEVLEPNQRELFQSIAPRDETGKPTTIAGLYLVPKVID